MKQRRIMLVCGGFAALLIGLMLVAGCSQNRGAAASPYHRFHPKEVNWPAIPAGQPLTDRLAAVGERELMYLRDSDHQPSYTAHQPTTAERELITREYQALPQAMRQVLDRSVVGMYLVDHFTGNALTDFLEAVEPGQASTRFILFINADILTQSLADRMSARESSAFAWSGKDGSLRELAEFKGDDGLMHQPSAIWFALSHEGAHLYDYARHVTPFVEPVIPLAPGQSGKAADHPLTKGIWKDFNRPEPAADFPGRNKLRFFGLAAPELPAADIPAVFDRLLASPFVSIYGSQNWAEDWAELFTWSRLADMGGELRIEFLDASGAVARSWKPLDNARVRARLAMVASEIR